MDYGILVPVYNHEHAIERTVESLRSFGLPCLLVDDGSSQACHAVLATLARTMSSWVSLLVLPENRGKGGAVMAGLLHAEKLGWTHVLQIDADGQHDACDVPRFVAQSRAHPDALICGTPVYDHTVPKGRFYGRYMGHLWVWINTLSFQTPDSMCGFRVYPLSSTLKVVRGNRLGTHMDFDIEILVRMSWSGIPMIALPTRVGYPSDGVSHFKLWRDNVRIVIMHAGLFFGMLWRSPELIRRKLRRPVS